MKVLIVDDSVVFRTQISAALQKIAGVEIVGSASNGKIALQKMEIMDIDLITLDMEMPVMDGLETIKAIREKGMTTIIVVFSSQTTRGAEKAILALQLGADNVVPKPIGSGDGGLEEVQHLIKDSLSPIIQQCLLHPQKVVCDESPPEQISHTLKQDLTNFIPEAIVIASSTGGPAALEDIFTQLKAPFSAPVFIAQHMPAVFTQILAKRIGEYCGVESVEAKHLELVQKNKVYIAPGNHHMSLIEDKEGVKIFLDQNEQRNFVRPAADYLFESAAKIYGKKLLGIVLTGMGEDGADGSRAIRNNGGAVLIQNKESCVVFGMPGSVYKNDDFDEIKNLGEIGAYLKTVLR